MENFQGFHITAVILMKLNKNKKIGKVLFIVEGSKTEFFIIHKIMVDIFNYKMLAKRRNKGCQSYGKKNDVDSIVYVINSSESAIKHIDDENYLNTVYVNLIENYDFELDNTQIYYIFDRDPKTNTDKELIDSYIKKYRNSIDNDEDEQGLILLSYPSIESFTLSNFDNEFYKRQFGLGSDLKQYLDKHKFNQKNISGDTLITATEGLINVLKEQKIEFDVNLFDDFSNTNITIHRNEELYYEKNNKYRCLSMFVMALLDLELIEL